MATKTFYATRDLKNPSYGTRMLKAGDPVELDGPKSRLYLALGAVSPKKPRGQSQAAPDADAIATAMQSIADKGAASLPKPAPKRKAARRKAKK